MTYPRVSPAMTALFGAVAILGAASTAMAQEHAHAAMRMPEAGLRAEYIADLEQLEQKFVGLAEAMVGKYDWRPGEGVRSVGEVLMHVAAANFLLPRFAGINPPERLAGMSPAEFERIADPAQVKEMLAHSFRHARHAIARIEDSQLDEMVTLFGRETTKRGVLTLIVFHNHEHLGQSIAYARVSGVVPPWSAAASD